MIQKVLYGHLQFTPCRYSKVPAEIASKRHNPFLVEKKVIQQQTALLKVTQAADNNASQDKPNVCNFYIKSLPPQTCPVVLQHIISM